jgi:hypothetical protein
MLFGTAQEPQPRIILIFKNMKSKEQIITEMCLAYRADYDTVLGVEDNDFGVGVTPYEREKIRRLMAKIYDEVILVNRENICK